MCRARRHHTRRRSPIHTRNTTRTRRRALAAGVVGAVALAGCSSAKIHGAATVTPAAPVTSSTTTPAVYPLTGLPVTNAANAARPALSVKVDNAPGSFPQAGLNQADLVADTLVEGGLTRLFVTFQSQDAPQVGPIRSARPVDAALLKELNDGIFAYSGAAAGEIAPVKSETTATLLAFDNGVPVFHLVHSRPSPHTVFAATSDLYSYGLSHGASSAPPHQLFTYSATPQGGSPASSVTMNLSAQSSAQWTWTPAVGYQRSQEHSPDVTTDGSVVNAQNVVIMSVQIGHTGIFDAAHNEDPLVILVGSGSLWVMRDGKMIQGSWQRPSIDSPVKLLTASGQPIPLHPGRTWLELLPTPNTPTFG
ncbi:MAG TPA: DUF3048 domain-containing protein [Acidimicrobiales bacterium]|nr:DUF3048 domain-containing protein [Acidimicrobiales bacterium]